MRNPTLAALAALAALISVADARAQSAPGAAPSAAVVARDAARRYRTAHEGTILRELHDLLAIPNLASDSANIRRNAAFIIEMLERRGVAARLLEAPGSPPAVLGELRVPGATRTVVFYAHYDGQPVTRSQWATDPWSPVLRSGATMDAPEIPLPADGDTISPEARIWARSASDDKAPIIEMLAALDALRAAGITPAANLKFFFEGEEEAGSPHITDMLTHHRDELAADAWLFCDGPVHQSGRTQIVFGVRGVMGVELTAYGPSRALHSGHYGNWAPNPLAELVHLLASMRDQEGHITIPGFSADVRPLTPAERRAIAALPPVEEELERELAIGRTEGGGARLAATLGRPALNIRGIEGGATGAAAANAIPTLARASLDFRLVPDESPARVRSLVEAHIRRQGWFIVHDSADAATRRAHAKVIRLQWDDGYAATRTSMELPVSRAVLRAVGDAEGRAPLAVPTLGGSLPMSSFAEVLRVPLVVVPTVNYDNNQHAANENVRIGNVWRGTEEMAALMAALRW